MTKNGYVPKPPETIRPAEMLLVIALPVRHLPNGVILFDLQSKATLVRYLNSFRSIIVASPIFNESELEKNLNFVWVPVDELYDRVQFIPLPGQTAKWKFPLDYLRTRRLLRKCIDASEFLQYGIGGGNGGLEYDWAWVAGYETLKKGRKFSLLSDAICYEGIRMKADRSKGLKRLALRAKQWGVHKLHTGLISRCDLMFCNGNDTYLEYRKITRSPEIATKINDFQIGPEKILNQEGIEQRCRTAMERPVFHVCYAGRVEQQKGPFDWVKAIRRATELGASIKATWLGDGSLFEAMRQEVKAQGMTEVIEMTGFVEDRDRVVDMIRESDVMMFAHLEPESPRVLIESLMSACPIVGYDRPHPRDLISDHQGGVITPLGDWKALGETIAALAADRPRLVDLIRRAGRDGARFNSDVMNRNRSELIKERLRVRPPAEALQPA